MNWGVYCLIGLGSLLASRSRKAIFAVIISIAVLGASSYAYLASLPPHEGPKVSTVSPPLEFSIQLERADFEQGGLINASLTLTNTGNKTIGLSWGNGDIFDLIVEDANGTHIWRWGFFHAHINAVVDKALSPDGSLAYYYWWDQRIPFEGMGPYPVGQVPKGTYFVKGSVFPFTLNVDGHVSNLSLETPTIAITIN